MSESVTDNQSQPVLGDLSLQRFQSAYRLVTCRTRCDADVGQVGRDVPDRLSQTARLAVERRVETTHRTKYYCQIRLSPLNTIRDNRRCPITDQRLFAVVIETASAKLVNKSVKRTNNRRGRGDEFRNDVRQT